jgi:hypothetical protein
MTTTIDNFECGLFDLSAPDPLRHNGLSTLQKARAAAISPTGNVYVAALNKSLSFYSLNEKEFAEVSTSPLPLVPHLVFSPDGRRLAVVDERGMRIWSVEKRQELYTLEQSICLGLLAFSLDGEEIAVCSADNVITLIDATTGTKQGEIKLDTKVIHALAFGPLPHLLSVATDNGIHILNCLTGKEIVRLNGDQGAVRSLAFSPDQNLLASGGADTTVLLWDMKSILARTRIAEEIALPKDQVLLWNDLGSTNALSGVTAIRALKAAGEATLSLLHERLLTPEKPFGAEVQRRLVAQLADPDYKVRAGAFAELKKNPNAAEPVLREEYRNTADEVLRLRLRTFLAELESENLLVPHDERLRERRVILLLEIMDSPGARKLLATLAPDAKSETLRAGASAALERMKPDEKPN